MICWRLCYSSAIACNKCIRPHRCRGDIRGLAAVVASQSGQRRGDCCDNIPALLHFGNHDRKLPSACQVYVRVQSCKRDPHAAQDSRPGMRPHVRSIRSLNEIMRPNILMQDMPWLTVGCIGRGGKGRLNGLETAQCHKAHGDSLDNRHHCNQQRKTRTV